MPRGKRELIHLALLSCYLFCLNPRLVYNKRRMPGTRRCCGQARIGPFIGIRKGISLPDFLLPLDSFAGSV